MGEKDRESIAFCEQLAKEIRDMGPDSFGGQDIPHGCLPDYHLQSVPIE